MRSALIVGLEHGDHIPYVKKFTILMYRAWHFARYNVKTPVSVLLQHSLKHDQFAVNLEYENRTHTVSICGVGRSFEEAITTTLVALDKKRLALNYESRRVSALEAKKRLAGTKGSGGARRESSARKRSS